MSSLHLTTADALSRVRLGVRASRLSMMQKDQLELAVVNDWALYDMTAVEHLVPRIEGLLQTDAAKARPDVCFALMLQSRQLPTWFAGDLTSMAPVVVDMALSLCSACETAPDFGMREFCAACACWTGWATAITALVASVRCCVV